MANHRKRAALVACVCGTGGAGVAFVIYALFGAATGVVAMCQSYAPKWWQYIYFGLSFSVPAFAVWTGMRSRRMYLSYQARRAFRRRHRLAELQRLEQEYGHG